MADAILIPAILTRDPEEIYEKLEYLESIPEISEVHIDFADGKMVPNLTALPADLWPAKTRLKLEAHLMVGDPARYFHYLEHFGVRQIILHYESFAVISSLLTAARNIKALGFGCGVAINPRTEVGVYDKIIDEIDIAQIMCVNPGFQGQPFIHETFDRLQTLRKAHPDAIIQVDGGINLTNIEAIRAHGANRIVVGSGIWQSKDPRERIYELLEKLK